MRMLPDLTPLMRQYRQVKQRYPDAILFFRVGDFYEMFYEDAIEGSRLLEIALTSRDKHKADQVPLCGVPYHAATSYIAKLLRVGRAVAVCDQVEDPQTDRKSTRLNSSHLVISYAVFCLKKKDRLPACPLFAMVRFPTAS